MSNVRYFIKSTNNPTTLYVGFSVKRGVLFRKTTQLQIDPKFFNNKTGKIRNIEKYQGGSELNETLEKLRAHIVASYNITSTKGEFIDSGWFGNVLNGFFNRGDEDNLVFLEDYAKNYVEKLHTKVNRDGVSCSRVTILKYTTIHRKIIAYEKARGKKYKITDVGLDFRDDFLKFLVKDLKLAENTAGRYIKCVKTISLDAKRSGLKVNPQLDEVRGFVKKTDKIILPFEEIELIEKKKFKEEKLDVARDWLLIGCYLGQRVSDLLDLTTDNLTTKGGYRMAELIQQKTKKRVSVLLHPKVESVLKKYKGKFPPRLRESVNTNKIVFNKLIKIVAKEAGITEVIFGGKFKKETKRKVWGNYPKWQLVSSHIMRRSFASNFYGDIPTALLMSCTGHGTEKMFLQYIGRSSIDYAEQLAKYWNT